MVNKTRVLFHKEETGICAGLVKKENKTLKVKLVLGKHIMHSMGLLWSKILDSLGFR